MKDTTKRTKVIPEHQIHRNDEGFRIEFLTPGVTDEQVDINLENRLLTIKASQAPLDVEGFQCLHREFDEVDFEAELRIPDTVDVEGISADLKGGVLALALPKAEAHQRRPITINAG